MKRRKVAEWFLWFVCVNEVAVFYCWCLAATTSDTSTNVNPNNAAVNKFQSALQQQNIFTILGSIEERLRNLDNIYSMQLSQNLEMKLDQYNRKLENFDNKIMRLEALVMLNLGKISENISSKNFKDDLTKTDTLRKLDSIYEGITHRLNYIERKFDTNYLKIQEKVDATYTHVEKIEKDSLKRDSDLETEMSAAILGIKDLTTTYNKMEKKILNVTEDALNVSKHTYSLLTKYNVDNRKSINKLHDNLIGNLQYIDNKTSEHIKISDDSNKLLKQMKIELKEDFNNYANKVADMNSDMWKNTDTTEGDLKNIALVVNSTKSELQNGVRSLMIQIGKVSHKDNDLSTGTDYRELEKKLTANFEKILTNQDVFLESCHRLQMDESQIESEISVVLNKLIDMLEKKLATESKDIKTFEKNLKNHDNRINRGLLQAHQNIISLIEKSRINTQILTNEIRRVGTDLNAMFTFVQSTINDGSTSTSVVTTKVILDKLNVIERTSKDVQHLFYNKVPENVTHYQIYREIQKLSKSVSTIIGLVQNHTRDSRIYKDNTIQALENIIEKNVEKLNPPTNMPTSTANPQKNETIRESVIRVFGNNPNKATQKPKRKCKQNVRKLIDIRADTDCIETPERSTKKPKKRKMKYDIDIRGDLNSDNDDYEDSTSTTDEVTTSTTEGTVTPTATAKKLLI